MSSVSSLQDMLMDAEVRIAIVLTHQEVRNRIMSCSSENLISTEWIEPETWIPIMFMDYEVKRIQDSKSGCHLFGKTRNSTNIGHSTQR